MTVHNSSFSDIELLHGLSWYSACGGGGGVSIKDNNHNIIEYM